MAAAPKDLLDQPPPHSIDAERAVLGCLLLKPDLTEAVQQQIGPGDFHLADYGRLYRHVCAAWNSDGAFDMALLKSRMQATGAWRPDDGALIAELFNSSPTAASIDRYVEIARDTSAKRRAIGILTDGLRACYNGHQTGDVLAKVTANLADIEVDQQTDGGFNIATMSAADLAAAEFKLDWLIDDVMVAQSPAFIGGGFKTLKTLVALDAAVSMATATRFLGVFPVQSARRVMYLSGEGGFPVLQDYVRRVVWSKGFELADVGGIFFGDALPQLANLEHLDALVEALVKNEVEVLFVDPLYLCGFGDNPESAPKQGKIFDNLGRACRKTRCTPVLVHHANRGAMRRQARGAQAVPEHRRPGWPFPTEGLGCS